MKQINSSLFTDVHVLESPGGCDSTSNEGTNSESSQGATQQWELLAEAYRYTFPLMMTEYTKRAATNTVEPDLKGHAPVNQLIHAQQLVTADFKSVVTPNVDTIYTQAWLDIGEEAMIYVKPETDRFFQVQVLDAWTNTPAVLKDAGTYLFTTPDWRGSVPDGVIQITVPTQTVWLLGRMVANGESDMENVHAIQSEMQLLPLSAYKAGGSYTAPQGEYKKENDIIPVNAVLVMNPQDYFTTANRLMETNSPAPEDADVIERFAGLHIGPGLTFDSTSLQGDIKTEWKSMLQSLRATLVKKGTKHQVQLGNWSYYDDPIGNFGTEYDYRALVALGGLGANPLSVAVYPKTNVDSDGNQLNGNSVYQLHFETLPPIVERGFWSVTAYGCDDFLIANEQNRYCINDRSGFTLNEDGTLDIILSTKAPEHESNWLPIGTEDFHLFLRIYQPDMKAMTGGWEAPVITKI